MSAWFDEMRVTSPGNLYDPRPWRRRYVAHRLGWHGHRTRCGVMSTARLTWMHHTVAYVLGLDECKSCAR